MNEREKIRDYIAELLSELDDHDPFEDDDSLIKTARLDSLVVVKLVMFLETTFGVDFTLVEFEPERFDSVSEIMGIVEESRQSA